MKVKTGFPSYTPVDYRSVVRGYKSFGNPKNIHMIVGSATLYLLGAKAGIGWPADGPLK